MTHPTYTQQSLSRYNLPHLKRIATELGVTPTGDKRGAETWVNAIINHQSANLQKVDEQAQPVALEKLTTVEISFYDHEFYALNELIAAITYDNNLTQPWVVMVNGVEKFRANTWARCHRFIEWHHQDGTLNEPLPEEEAEGQRCRGEGIEFVQGISSAPPLPCSLAPLVTKSWRRFSTNARSTALKFLMMEFTTTTSNWAKWGILTWAGG
jgi:hypothetical protein